MSFTRALYEGDSVIHSEFRAGTAVNPRIAGTKRVAQPATALEMAELATASRIRVRVGEASSRLREAGRRFRQSPRSLRCHEQPQYR